MADNLLRRLVGERHWNYQAFVNQFERAAASLAERDGDPRLAKLTVSEKTYKRWTSGEIRGAPMPDVRRVLEFMFERKIDALFDTGTLPSSTGANPGAVRQSPDTESLIHMAAQRALRYSTLMQGSGVTPEGISLLQHEATRIALAYQYQPLESFIGDLVNLQDISFQMLEGKYRADQSRDLHLLAGITCGMLAKASHDTADSQSALANARAAYLCAEHAGHDGLKAWVRAVMSLTAYWAGRPLEALKYAQLGESIAGAAGGVTVWLPSLEARAHAALGDTESTYSAIERSHRARERLEPSDLDGLGDLFVFPLEKQHYYIAEAIVRLAPSSDDAVHAADAAVTGYLDAESGNFEWSSLAGAQAHQALARLTRAELEGAREALTPVFAIEPARRIHGIRVSLGRVYRQLPPGSDSTPHLANELREEIEDFTRTGPKALPR